MDRCELVGIVHGWDQHGAGVLEKAPDRSNQVLKDLEKSRH